MTLLELWARTRQLGLIGRYAVQQFRLARRGRASPVAQIHDQAWFAVGNKRLPTVSLEALFPGISALPVHLQCVVPKLPGNLTADELSVLALLCQRLRPRALFEFGTFNGRTTLNLALNTPAEARVYTLDLPNPGHTILPTAADDGQFYLGRQSGELWRESPAAAKIEQLWADSAHFDEQPYRDRMDLVFVDGAHSYEYVRNDSAKALSMVRRDGVVVWDDYCAWYPGVVRHLHELLERRPVRHVAGTHLAILVGMGAADTLAFGVTGLRGTLSKWTRPHE
jgi:predicted O-methyltransferase YrrM